MERPVFLQLFADGGQGGAEAAGAAAAENQKAQRGRAATGEQTRQKPGKRAAAKADAQSPAITGEQAEAPREAAPEQPAESPGAADLGMAEAPEDLQAEFDALIQGKFKDLFHRRLESALAEQSKTAEADTRRLEQAAGQVYDAWLHQAQETKDLYPTFSMEESLRNPRFCALLRGGADVRTAYETLHVEKIIPAAMAVAARAVEARLARSIATSGSRPAENAMDSRAAAVIRTDVSRLTKSDMEEVARRVARGERVSFG